MNNVSYPAFEQLGSEPLKDTEIDQKVDFDQKEIRYVKLTNVQDQCGQNLRSRSE